MNLTKGLLVVAAGLILATQAQAELIDFSVDPSNPLTLTEGDVAGIVVTFSADPEFGRWDGDYDDHTPTTDNWRAQPADGANMTFSENVEVPSLWVSNHPFEYGDPLQVHVVGSLLGSEQWSMTNPTAPRDGTWTEITAGAGLEIDTLTFADVFDGGVDDITVVPEPATLALLGLGGLGLLVSRKRR